VARKGLIGAIGAGALCCTLLAACESASAPQPPVADGAPPGVNTTEPFPIDRGDDGAQTPGTYQGLWLRLVNNGAPTVTPIDGIIGIVCVGMSNANQECSDYVSRVATGYAAAINPGVRVVNCAVGGHAIERWNDSAFDATLWDDCVSRRLPAAGVRLDQVRVLYHKAANQFTTGAGGAALPSYPAPGSDFENFIRNLGTFAARVKSKFPAVQAVYTTSRSYGGYADNAGRGEPLSYEEGHALNEWLRDNPRVDGVWYGWGPYIWAPACGTGVTNGSQVCYDRADYVDDGVHPSPSGRAKVSAMIHARLLGEAWYRR
jgi:hypothetical protein